MTVKRMDNVGIVVEDLEAAIVKTLEIRHPDFTLHRRWVLEESGIEPRRLILELTESSRLAPRFAAVLHEVHALGVRTALDDFGNGYSRLKAMTSAGAGVED